jgi:hydroxyacylglutathione hydrolase
VLLADDPRRIAKGRHNLMLIGLDRVVAAGGKGVREAWRDAHGPLQRVEQLDVKQLAAQRDRRVLDVRRSTEWREGHLGRAEHFYLGDLEALSQKIPRDTPIAVHCQGGTRSAIAASLLQAQGFTNVANVAGGIHAWTEAGLPVESE